MSKILLNSLKWIGVTIIVISVIVTCITLVLIKDNLAQELEHKVFIPILSNSVDSNIIKIVYERDLSRSPLQEYSIAVYWENQGWESYYLWFREVGTEVWCHASEGSSTKYRRSVRFDPFVFVGNGPSSSCRRPPVISFSKEYEMILANNIYGQETAKSAMRLVSFKNDQNGNGSFFYPELTATVELYPIEDSGVVTVKWFGLSHWLHRGDLKYINGDGKCVPVYGTNPNNNSFESGRSMTVTNLIVGETYKLYVVESDVNAPGCDPKSPYVDEVTFTLR